MASLRQRGGLWHVAFYWRGRQFERSLDTPLKAHAERLKARIELFIQSVRQGLVTPPAGSDEPEWIFTAGQRGERPIDPDTQPVRTLGELLERYAAAMPDGSRAPNTVYTENIHHRNLKALIGERKPIAAVGLETLQRYVTDRGKKAEPATILKELSSLRVAWRWAADAGRAPACPSLSKLRYPKSPEKPPFRHAEEIRREVQSRRLKGPDAAELWECLVLTLDEVRAFVAFVKAHVPHQWFADAVEIAAYTGARRSELCRLTTADVDWRREEITIRERKRVHKRSETRRSVPIAKALKATLKRLTAKAGPLLQWRRKAIVPHQFATQWDGRRKGTQWEHVRGLHVLRHSFASNLAAAGVSPALFDSWVGHQTEEMRKRYRHFFPSEKQKAIEALG
jgi:integrase